MDVILKAYKEFLLLLLKRKVEFIIIGGYAVIYYGYERSTTDIDLWLRPDNSNRNKFINAIKEYGIFNEDIKALMNLDFNAVQIFHIGEKPNKMDFLTKIAGVDYTEADKEKEFFLLQDQPVFVINFHHLVVNKMLSERLKDKADIEELQKIRKFKKRKKD